MFRPVSLPPWWELFYIYHSLAQQCIYISQLDAYVLYAYHTVMLSKRRRKQLKFARAISLEVCKKRRLEASLLSNSVQLNCKLSNIIDTTNTTNIEDKSGTWFWNQSANKTDSNIEEEGNSNHKNNLEGNKFRIEEAVCSDVPKVEIK